MSGAKSLQSFEDYQIRDKKIREMLRELNLRYFNGKVSVILGYCAPRGSKVGEFIWGECGEKFVPGIEYPVRFVNLCALLLEKWVPLYVVKWQLYHELVHLFRRDYRKKIKCDHNQSFWNWMQNFQEVDETKLEIWMIRHAKVIAAKSWWVKELKIFVVKYKAEIC